MMDITTYDWEKIGLGAIVVIGLIALVYFIITGGGSDGPPDDGVDLRNLTLTMRTAGEDKPGIYIPTNEPLVTHFRGDFWANDVIDDSDPLCPGA